MNAIIIAAGSGTRLRPLTYETPKPLINVLGKPMIERNIEYLLEKNIKEIIIVTGYLNEKFEYLKEKYEEVKIVHNDKFGKYNNIYSFYLIKDYLEDSYILDGDIYITENIFLKDIEDSKYFSKKVMEENDEWQLILKDGKVKEVLIGGKENYIMSGVSFFNKESTKILKRLVEEYVKDEEKLKKCYWDNMVKENIERFNIGVQPIDSNKIYEIDNLEELKALDERYVEVLRKVENAVILAAGKSKDFSFPNGLIEIDKKRIIERSIELLLKNGIKNIFLVIGYKKEEYLYLKDKYKEIKLIENDDYLNKGSYFSLKCIGKDINKDVLILDSDIIYDERALRNLISDLNKNMVLVSSEKGQKDESFVEEKKGFLYKISKDKRELKNIQGEMLGIAKISKELLNEILNLKVENDYFSYEYAISECCKNFDIKVLRIDELAWGEIDTEEHLEFIKKSIYPRIKKIEEIEKLNEIENILLNTLKLKQEQVEKIETLGGMTNRNYLAILDGKKYVLRNPGEGTFDIINRYNEKKNAFLVSELEIDSHLIFFNEETGLKISEYIKNAETLNPTTAKNNFRYITNILKRLHESNIKFSNKFDAFFEIEKYEKLSIKENGKFYDNYEEIKKEIFKLREKLDSLHIELKPCHNDTVPENFIKSGENIYLIDWEYSGMNDPMWDLAAHSLECDFSKEEEKEFLSFYFSNGVTKEELLRIQIHKICQDFLWSIWTILKEAKGVSFGDYGINRYKRAIKLLGELKNYE